MRFVVRYVGFGLFFLENVLICAVTAWGPPELGTARPVSQSCLFIVLLMFGFSAVEMLTKTIGKQKICSQTVETSPSSR